MAGFRIWAAFQYFFAYRDLMGEDWDQVLRNRCRGWRKRPTPGEYALAVAEMVAHVHDSHAASICSRALSRLLRRMPPPIRTRMIEGAPVVTTLWMQSPRARRASLSVT